jgi:hypothetical protein
VSQFEFRLFIRSPGNGINRAVRVYAVHLRIRARSSNPIGERRGAYGGYRWSRNGKAVDPAIVYGIHVSSESQMVMSQGAAGIATGCNGATGLPCALPMNLPLQVLVFLYLAETGVFLLTQNPLGTGLVFRCVPGSNWRCSDLCSGPVLLYGIHLQPKNAFPTTRTSLSILGFSLPAAGSSPSGSPEEVRWVAACLIRAKAGIVARIEGNIQTFPRGVCQHETVCTVRLTTAALSTVTVPVECTLINPAIARR